MAEPCSGATSSLRSGKPVPPPVSPGAVDGVARALVRGAPVTVSLRSDALVNAVTCTDANGLVKVKVVCAKLVNGRLFKVQQRRILAKIGDADVRRRLLADKPPPPGRRKPRAKHK